PRHDIPIILRPVRPATPVGLAGREAHAARRTAIQSDENDVIASSYVLFDEGCDGLGEPPAMGAVGRRVVLLVDGPPAPDSSERKLGARQLLQEIAAAAQRLNDRAHESAIARAITDLGVLIQETV